MRYAVLVALACVVGCADHPSLPTAPSTVAVVVNQPPAVVVTPPVTVTPPVVTPSTPTTNPLLSDPRFSLSFYRMLVLNWYEAPNTIISLHRFTQAPRIYLRTIDSDGRTIDATTLDQTAAALINAAGEMTGAFGLAGMEQGTGSKIGQPGWLTVRWLSQAENTGRFCGYSSIGAEGGTLDLFLGQPNCGCSRFRMAPRVIKHELGHALGFYHTDSRDDLMWGGTWPLSQCEMGMNEREKFHARVAYSEPIGSLDPK